MDFLCSNVHNPSHNLPSQSSSCAATSSFTSNISPEKSRYVNVTSSDSEDSYDDSPTTSFNEFSEGYDTNISLKNCKICKAQIFRNNLDGNSFCKICKSKLASSSNSRHLSSGSDSDDETCTSVNSSAGDSDQNCKIQTDGRFFMDSMEKSILSKCREETPSFYLSDLKQNLKIRSDGSFYFDYTQPQEPPSKTVDEEKSSSSFYYSDLKRSLKIRRDGTFYLDW